MPDTTPPDAGSGAIETSAETRSWIVRLWVSPGPRTNQLRLELTMPSARTNSYRPAESVVVRLMMVKWLAGLIRCHRTIGWLAASAPLSCPMMSTSSPAAMLGGTAWIVSPRL